MTFMSERPEEKTWQSQDISTMSTALESQIPHSAPLLRTRLHIPPRHPLSIARPHLIARLHQAREFKLTLVSAPTGYGKTTLLSEWASQQSAPVLWVTLDASDNDPARFWAYFIEALSGLAQKGKEQALQRLYQDPRASILADITDLIETISQDFFFILDDYHAIQNACIHAELSALLTYLPRHMHICISSRTRPPLPLSRLRVLRQFQELRPADLLFTLEEIETFLTQTLKRNCSTEQAQVLKTCTDGWIAIVHLVVLWLQEQKNDWTDLERLPGNQSYIFDYLVEEVLHQQSELVQEFLLQTSLLEQFNCELCDFVTGQHTASLLLEQIEQANLFLIPLDEQKRWYSYHPIFRTFLQERLELNFSSQVSLLHHRASIWYAQHMMPAEAISHALAIQDFEQAAGIILQSGEALLRQGEASTLAQWLGALPVEFVRLYPLLCLFYTWSLIVAGQFNEAMCWVENASSMEKETTFISAAQQMESQKNINQAQQMESINAVLRAHIAIFWDEINQVKNLTLQIQEILPLENAFVQSLNLLNLGVMNWLSKNFAEAEKNFTDAACYGRYRHDTYVRLAADCGLLVVSMNQGKRRAAFSIAQQALQITAKQKKYLSPFSIYLYTETSGILYEWNRLDEAMYYAQEALTYGEKQSRDIRVYGYILLARIKQAQGDIEAARLLLQQAERCLPDSQQRPWVLIRLAEQYVLFALATGNIERAQYWSQIPELDYFGSLSTILPMRIALARNRPAEALLLVKDPVSNASAKPKRELLVIILCALAYQKLGETSTALEVLDTALRLGEPEGYIRFFLDGVSELSGLLSMQLHVYETRLGQSSDSDTAAVLTRLTSYVRRLLAVSTEPIHEPLSSLPVPEAGCTDTLSGRELDVLRGITIGLSNQEIARQLTVAESTVKWHVQNIYSKLQVHNRVQAIREARKFQLL